MPRPSRRNPINSAAVAAPSATIQALPPFLTIETAEATYDELRTLLHNTPGDLVLDAGPVEVMTTPGIQLLVALGKTLTAKGNALHLQGARPAVAQLLAQLGAHAFLKLDSYTTEA